MDRERGGFQMIIIYHKDITFYTVCKDTAVLFLNKVISPLQPM